MPTNDPTTTGPDATASGDAESTPSGGRGRRWAIRILVGVVALVALGYGAIWIYATFINDPADELTADDLRERLEDPVDPASGATPTTESSSDTTIPTEVTTPSTDSGGTSAPDVDTPEVDGTWFATPASELGYRVTEILFGVDTEGVGRTNQVTGSLTIEGTQVVDAEFDVDMASVESDDSRRDGQFRGRLMTVVEYPTATFVLTEPIELGRIPEEGEQITAEATGELTLRGVTNPVTFEVTAQLQNDRIGVLGNIRIVFADYGIVNPSIAGITTEDNGLLEFVLVFERD